MPLINQPTAKPTRKMAATGGALTLTTLLVLAASYLGVEIPEEVAAAFVAVVSWAVGYLVRDRVPEFRV